MVPRKIEPIAGGPGSVTNWLDQLRQFGSNERLELEVWNRYFRKLAAVARNHLTPTARRTIDEEDIALSALNSFFAKLDQGNFPQLSDRDQLWALLTTIATYKAINARTRLSRHKRGGGKLRGDSAFSPANSLHELAATEPGPRELVEFKELVSRLLTQLDPALRKIAHEKLKGKSIAEIAEQLDVSPRTIHRKLARIRSCWQTELGDA